MIDELIKSVCITGDVKSVSLRYCEGEDRLWEAMAVSRKEELIYRAHDDNALNALHGLARKIRTNQFERAEVPNGG